MTHAKVFLPSGKMENVNPAQGTMLAQVTAVGALIFTDSVGSVMAAYAPGQWVKFSSDLERTTVAG